MDVKEKEVESERRTDEERSTKTGS